MSKTDRAVQCFQNGFNCAQAILSTYGGQFGLDETIALKLSCGLGAGMGRNGDTCGAVSAAYLLIGLKHGQDKPDDKDAKEKTYALVQKFADRISALHGSTMCRDLLGFDLKKDKGAAAEARVSELCPVLVRDCAGLIEEILEISIG